MTRTVPPPIRVAGTTLHFENRTLIMGVLNITPDSFSDGGRFDGVQSAVAAGMTMLEQGADILDVGGESTRPGAAPVSISEEIRRVVPVIEALRKAGAPCISVDTRNAPVAAAALEAGAGMVNDVSALTHDPAMTSLCVKTGCALVLMHMRGTPGTMQQGIIHYDDVVEDVSRYLEEAAAKAEAAGVLRSQVMLDPGFGFGKTVQHNLELLAGVERLCRSGRAVLWGPSRKSTLGAVTGGVGPRERLHSTVAACVMAADRGAHMVRVHDVAEVRQALAVVDAVRGAYIAPA
ncbi:MAG: dihydropteroate synthase [Myxococcota bacterium]